MTNGQVIRADSYILIYIFHKAKAYHSAGEHRQISNRERWAVVRALPEILNIEKLHGQIFMIV